MFQWTTTTLINSERDFRSNLPLFSAIVDGDIKVLRIKRDLSLCEKYIEKIYRKEAEEETLCELTINFAPVLSYFGDSADWTTPVQSCELNFYITLEGSEEHLYANDWYKKGKPFAIGFDIKKNDTAATVVERIVKNASKYNVMMYVKKIFEFIDNGDGTLTIKGTHEHQRIQESFVTTYVDPFIYVERICQYVDGKPGETDDDVYTLENRGTNGFGTYYQIVKDLRLPTAQNTKFYRIREDETPVIGAKYNQYIITYAAPSMANPSFTTIGERNISVTTHVFWVNQAVDAAFKTVVEKVVGTFTADGPGVTAKAVQVATTASLQETEDGEAKNEVSFGKDRDFTVTQPDLTTPALGDTADVTVNSKDSTKVADDPLGD